MRKLSHPSCTVIWIILLIGCTSSKKPSDEFIGKWTFNDTVALSKGFNLIDITPANENFIFKYHGNKYPAQINKGVLSISIKQEKQDAVLDNNDQLIFNGETFVRLEKTNLNNFLGTWFINKDSTKEEIDDIVMKISIDESKNELKVEFGNNENGKFNPSIDYSKGIHLHEIDALEGYRVVVPGTSSYDEYIYLKMWGKDLLKCVNFGQSDTDPTRVYWYNKK